MRCISIRAPWWWCILHAGKRVENRGLRFSRYTGPVLLHASKWWVKRDIVETLEHLVLDGKMSSDILNPDSLADMRAAGGHVVGVTTILRVEPNGSYPDDYWAADDQLGLWLGAVREVVPQIPAKGALGLFELEGVDLP